MLNVEYGKESQKFLQKLKDKNFLRRIFDDIEILRANPFPRGCIKVKGYNGKMFRIRVGGYRILYYIDYEYSTLYVFNIDKRGSVYE